MARADWFSSCEFICNRPCISDKKSHSADLQPFMNQAYQRNMIVKLSFEKQGWQWHQKANREKLNFNSVCGMRKKSGFICRNMKSECHLDLIAAQIFSPREALWVTLLTWVLECVSACGSNQLALSVGERASIHCCAIQLSEKVANKSHWRNNTGAYRYSF